MHNPAQRTPSYLNDERITRILFYQPEQHADGLDTPGVQLYAKLERIVESMNKMNLAYYAATPQEIFDRLFEEEISS